MTLKMFLETELKFMFLEEDDFDDFHDKLDFRLAIDSLAFLDVCQRAFF